MAEPPNLSGTAMRSAAGEELVAPAGVIVPPASLPMLYRGRLRKQWRYVAVWSPQLLLSVCEIDIGPAHQEFWSCCVGSRLHERTRRRRGLLSLSDQRIVIQDGFINANLKLSEIDSFQTLAFDKRAYTWTQKRLVRVHGAVELNGERYLVDAPGLIDDSAGYHPRRTHYKWSAGAGTDTEGRAIAWNVVEGINDSSINSERTVWIDGVPSHVPPVKIDDSLSGLTCINGERLDFHQTALRETHDNVLVIRSHYRHAFGSYSGTLPGNIRVQQAVGVMENHAVHW